MHAKTIAHMTPGRVILISLLATIAGGTFVLFLPASQVVPIPWIDLLFTATSATCVTGLATVPISAFTPLGQLALLVLMQIGGLGLITMTIFVLSLFTQIGFSTQLLVGKILELESWKNIKQLLFFIIKFSIAVELTGAACIYFCIQEQVRPLRRIFMALFHSVSSFCEAGFTVWPDSMMAYANNIPLLIITALLMIVGGLGFITWTEIFEHIKARAQQKHRFLSLYTKIVLYTTFSLIFFSTTLYWALERTHAFAHMPFSQALINAFFNAVASRSTGFITVYTTHLHIATLFAIMLIAFIGSSPGSTGSGIKTTTFAVLLATIHAAISGRTSVEIKGRRIPRDQVFKALAIIGLSVGWIIMTIFCLLITEQAWEFFDIVFEVVSAFATLGLSTGITPDLTIVGKLLIALTMIVGRIGSLTLVLAIMRNRKELHEYEYPEERIMLG
ncbi:MAG: potassium transporter TrkG [Candidatus Babeliales bacterium]